MQMRNAAKLDWKRIGDGIYWLANRVIQVIGCAIFLFLIWYSMRYTQYMIPGPWADEIPVNVQDTMVGNMLCLVVAIGIFVGLFLLDRKLSEKTKKWVQGVSVTLVTIAIGVSGFWWITTIERLPIYDQLMVCNAATGFIRGDYSFLERDGYCGMYPHQLGIVALLEVFFRVVGTNNYFACQVVLVLMAIGCVLLGYVLVRHLSRSMAVAVAYCVLMLGGGIQLVAYTGWIYGDLPCIFFLLLAAVGLLYYHKTEKKRGLVIMVLATVLAMLVRKNSLITIIALGLVGGIYVVYKRDRRLLVALLLSIILPGLAYSGIFKMYEMRSGIEHSDGFSNISFVAMGMQEYMGKNGWYTFYCMNIYHDQGLDTELSGEVAKEYIRTRLQEFASQPSYAWDFYREKILSQWNAPLFQSLYFAAMNPDGFVPEEDSLLGKINIVHFKDIVNVSDRVQFVIYFGMFCYFLFAVRKDSNILQHMLAVAIIGGFFFSIIWEAKARYIFPYYIMMIPVAVIGYLQALQYGICLRSKYKAKVQKLN